MLVLWPGLGEGDDTWVGVAAGLGSGPSLMVTFEPRGMTWMNVCPAVSRTGSPFLS